VRCFEVHCHQTRGKFVQGELQIINTSIASAIFWSGIFMVIGGAETWIPVKSKVAPLHAIDGALGERRYSSYTFLSSSLEGVAGQHHAPAGNYPQGKDLQYPLYRRLHGSQSLSGCRG
jgi:hypothetical protein